MIRRLASATALAALSAAAPGDGIAPLLEKFCFDCHGDADAKANVRLDDLRPSEGAPLGLWSRVYEQVSRGQMPPADKPQPSAAERQRILDGIAALTARQLAAAGAGGGRRLNRRELSAALQDLTGLPIDFAAGLPGDALVDGFDTGASALQDAADSVAQTLEVTRRAVDSIRFLEPHRGRRIEIDFRQHEFTDFRKWVEAGYGEAGIFTRSKRLSCKQGVGLFLPTEWSGDRGNSFLALPAPRDRRAAMTVRLCVSAQRPIPGLPAPILWVKVGGKYIDHVPVGDDPQVLSYALRMEDHLVEDGVIKIMLRSVVELPYAIEGFENDDRSKPGEVPGGIGVYRPKFDRKQLREPSEQPVPAAVVEWIEVDYDHRSPWPPPSWGIDLGTVKDDEASARRLLSAWVERAWRRPATPDERQRYLALYRQLRDEGFGFDDSLRAAFQAVLMGGAFRYLGSPAHPDPTAAAHATASRLSFMLRGAPPDAALRQLATDGGLHHPQVLDAEVERLLATPGDGAFFAPFATGWLSLNQPLTLTMSHLKKQDFRFGRHLKESMRQETIRYVAELFLGNRPAKEIVASDWTMANDILAVHYGLGPVEGAALRKVSVRPRAGDPRGGGILGHAGIQSMLCWMGDNWVIYRGAWALDRLLDDPPPPPPLDVPELNPSDSANRGKSFRELLLQHQRDQRCSICHRTIDPMGFAFQNFDLSGRWRDREYHHYVRNELDGKIEWRGEGATRPVDAAGRLPGGESFSSYAEFKALLVEHYQDDIVRGLLKKLALYGTGRQPHALDLQTIELIMDRERGRGYRLLDLLKALVRSPVFSDHAPTGDTTP